ncbi:hypothetical protein TraAM80_08318 [Trypanosoma rangeli]|uniref:Vesicle transport protein n=1 Tax=Trypanosoma rangeli TaxID=5698 RepID=A0A422N175_TRYRA|nr:uncharacterized protein TraAM80_08318 [Trypanosoma rangeli]RNE99215.1 hypothetical protein TraAM80_08318 [Trypanosoma rangeli]|eukprot:RNE99215.1 hypothetical protein TraAM80_08318 [Trypanosoma rangeli]
MEMPQGNGMIDDLQELSSLTYRQRFVGFFATLGMGLCFIAIAAFFAPTVAVFPKKFTFFLTTGNIFCVTSTAFLVGFQKQMRSFFDAKRLEAAVMYAVSTILTLVAALYWKSSLFSIIFAVVQVFCLLWYALSYVPFARRAVGLVCSYLWLIVWPVLRVVYQALQQCCGAIASRAR